MVNHPDVSLFIPNNPIMLIIQASNVCFGLPDVNRIFDLIRRKGFKDDWGSLPISNLCFCLQNYFKNVTDPCTKISSISVLVLTASSYDPLTDYSFYPDSYSKKYGR